MVQSKTVAVIGGGAFGTAIAVAVARSGARVKIFCRRDGQADIINASGYNADYLPHVRLPSSIVATSDLTECLGADVCFLAVPSRFLGEYSSKLAAAATGQNIVVNLAKGLDPDYFTFDKIFLPFRNKITYVTLKGPTFARQLANGEPSSFTVGATELAAAQRVADLFCSSAVAFDYHSCPASVDLVSALKNVYAIVLGIGRAIDLSDNSTYMLTTDVLREAAQVMNAISHDGDVLSKYCGVGDMLLTGSCDSSRNRTLGIMLGKGVPIDHSRTDFLTEGVRTVRIMLGLVGRQTAPFIGFLDDVLAARVRPNQLMAVSLARQSEISKNVAAAELLAIA